MKRSFVLMCLVAGVCLAGRMGGADEPAPVAPGNSYHAPAAPAAEPKPLPDADALARRLPFEQDDYAHVRDAALAAYARQHPGTHPYDAEAQQTIRLACYLCVGTIITARRCGRSSWTTRATCRMPAARTRCGRS